MTKRIKRIILETTFFGVIVLMSTALLAKVSPTYKTKAVASFGSVKMALIQVPVPIQDDMEGHKVQYTVNCTMKKSILECAPL